MLRIDTDFTLDDLEEGLRSIGRGEPELSLPNSITANAVGSLAGLTQLIITWARQRSVTPTLRLWAADPDASALRNFAMTPTGLTAINMAQRVELLSGAPIERREALGHAFEFVKAMHDGSLAEVRKISKSVIPVICVDNASTFRRPRRLYSQATGLVLERSAFSDLAAASIKMLRQGQAIEELWDTKLPAIGNLLYEAFLNTDEHAQADFLGNRYRRSMRGILFGHQQVRLDKLQAMAGASQPLKEYFANWRPSHAGAKNGQFVEISIFDSGPGLAQSWLGKRKEITRSIVDEPIPITREYEAVLDCLKKGQTTKAHDTRGNGLFRVMQVVKRSGGFLKLRSGRLSLIKAFPLSAHAHPDPSDIEMVDTRTGRVPDRQAAWADGTLLTVMVPLNRGA